MNIDELLNKYFEGETSSAEEQELRLFFSSDCVPERLLSYRPMFKYFDEEISKQSAGTKVKTKRISFRKRNFIRIMSGVAACGLFVLLAGKIFFTPDPCICAGNYVIINGKCYTDIDKVRSMAFSALSEVTTPTADYFPEEELLKPINQDVIQTQLNELSTMFNENF